MREKYIDERWPDLMIFGREVDTRRPFVSDADMSVDILCVDDERAQMIVSHYNKLKAEFTAMAQAFDRADEKAFNEFWYKRKG